ncbi:Gldg family protein [Butyricimonas paravirosa]|uniref:Gldg family protein n=1 Tax=Butyricimonas paravirosa TaxID=1472417 RepID=UPI002A7EDF7B|nr:Gldg family protein [Butyricimonas paravirosa]
MRAIYKIAKTELQMLFYSPIAWLLLLCFVIQTAVFFTGMYGDFVLNMEKYGRAFDCSNRLFVLGYGGGNPGLWYQVTNFLYMYIPLLTMGVITKELSSGSIKLLYSSPISNVHIILGKFCAMATYAFILCAVLFLYVLLAGCTIEGFEWVWILTGLFGLFLLTCTYMAVGIFVSSLTSYQVISAVGTFIVLMLLSMVSGWGQQYDLVREITFWLGISGRAATFIQGMICSEDLIYFPVVTGMFLALTIIRLHAIRQKQKFSITLYKNTIVIAIVCVIAFVSSRPSLLAYVDTTSTKQNTLTEVSQDIVSQLDGGLTITSYVNLLDPRYNNYAYPYFIINNRNEFRQYTRFKPEIDLKVVYYYADPAGRDLGDYAWQQARRVCEMYDLDSMMFLSKAEVDQLVDLSEEGYTFIRQAVRENGQKEWLRDFTGGKVKEAETSVALKRMVVAQVPKIGFLTGHRERNLYGDFPTAMGFIMSHKGFSTSMFNSGFDIEEITLEKRIPAEINILWIADLRIQLTPEEEAVLAEYIERGGNLVFMGEPRHREVQNALLAKYFGLELTPLVVGPDVRFKGTLPTANILAARPTKEGIAQGYQLGNTFTVVHENCSGIEQIEDKGWNVTEWVKCDTVGQFWTELETTDFLDDTVRFNPSVGEVMKEFTTVVGLNRTVGDKEQRVIVTGDVDCLANSEFTIVRGVSSSNAFLGQAIANWLTYGEIPLDTRRPQRDDKYVSLRTAGFGIVKNGFLFGLPILLLGCGLYIWIRRRGR